MGPRCTAELGKLSADSCRPQRRPQGPTWPAQSRQAHRPTEAPHNDRFRQLKANVKVGTSDIPYPTVPSLVEDSESRRKVAEELVCREQSVIEAVVVLSCPGDDADSKHGVVATAGYPRSQRDFDLTACLLFRRSRT